MRTKRLSRALSRFLLVVLNLATIFSVAAAPVLAAAPQVTGVQVTERSIQIDFDQAVNMSQDGNPTGETTSYADDLRNYSFQYPIGTDIPIVRNSPYNNWTGYVSGNATSTVNIFGMNLTQGEDWHLHIQNIGTATSTPEIMTEAEYNGTVEQSIDPVINNISPLYAVSTENATTSFSITGDNLPSSVGSAEVFCQMDDGQSELEVVSSQETSITAVLTVGASESSGRKECYVRDTDTGKESQRRPIFLYDSDSYGILYGTIKDVDGQTPVDKVETEAYTNEKNWDRYYGISQADGKFAVVLPAGTYNLSYKTPGAGSTGAAPLKSTGLAVTAGSATNAGTINFVSPTLTGHVDDIGGSPLYGARLTVHNQNWTIEQQAYTGINGTYKVYVTPSATASQYTIEVNPSDYDTNVNDYLGTTDTANVVTVAVKDIQLSLPNVSGVVMTPIEESASNPYPNTAVPRARVRITDNANFDRWTNTDDEGAFAFSGIPNGTYSIELEAPFCGEQDPDVAKYCGYVRTRLDGYSLPSIIDEPLRFSTPNFFGYVFADQDDDHEYDLNEAVANAWVNINSQGFWSGGQTNNLGRYAFSLPNTGNYRLEVQATGNYASYSADIQVTSLPSGRDIELTTPNLTGYVYGPDGEEAQAYNWVEICPYNSPGQCYGSQTNNSGAFSVNVPDGQWTMRVNTNWNSFYVAPSPYTIVISSGSLASVVKSGQTYLAPGVEGPWTEDGIIVLMIDPANDANGFNGTVFDPSGTTPQANVGIGMRSAVAEGSSCRGDGMSRWTQTNQSGRFAYSEITPGLYEIEAMPWGNSQYSRVRMCYTVSAEDPLTRSLDINLTQPNLTGTVKTPVGEESEANPTPDTAVAYGWVSLMQEGPMGPGGGGWFGGNTNENGIFSLGGINAGTYTLEINPGWNSVYSSKRFQGITIDADGNCTTVSGGDADPDDNACDFNTLAGVGDNTAVRTGIPNLYGVIVAPDGEGGTDPVQNAWVMVHSSNWMVNGGGNTDADGKFRIGGLSDGTYQIEVNMPWGGQQAYVLPGGLSVGVVSEVGTVMRDGEPLEDNIITLTEPTKTISGIVEKEGGSAVTNARVSARKDMGGSFFETVTDAEGGYELKVAGGSWWVEVRPDYGSSQPDWIYNQPPKRITFSDDETEEAETADFSVTPTDATIIGTVKTPNNEAVQYAWVEIRGNKGMGSGGQTDNNGRFSVMVPAGTYNVNVFANSGDYGAPDPRTVTVAADGISDAGTLYLKTKNSHITGFVQDDSGNVLSNVVVNAQLFNGPGWAMTYTDQTGAYDLSVWAGTWNVMVMPMSQSYVYQGAPKQVTVTESETSDSNNFELKVASKTLKVTVRDESDESAVTDIWGGVWVRDTAAGMIDFGGPMDDMMEKSGMMGGEGGADGGMMGGPGMEKGGFMGGGLVNGYTEIKVPSGTFELGIGMPPGSRYTLVETASVTVSDEDESVDVDIFVKENLAEITGQFYVDDNSNDAYDAGEEVAIRAFINADRDGGGWQATESDESDGTYVLNVAGGDWFVNAFIDPFMSFGENQYMVINDNTRTSVDDEGSATRNILVKRLDSTITGTVNDPDGEPLGGVWVFADFGSKEMVAEFKGPGGPGLGVFTDADGSYELNVPAGTYKIGAGVPPWDTRDLLNPDPIVVTVASDAVSEGNDLEFLESDATISGEITLDGEGATGYVRGWSDDGRGSGTISTDGTYELKVTQGDIWHVVAAAMDDNQYYESEEAIVDTGAGSDYTQDLELLEKNLTIPDGVSSTFDSSESKTVKLTKIVGSEVYDEVVMEIPAGSIASSGTITVSITPTVNVKPDSKDKPIGLAYEFEARDADGNKIESFNSNVTIYINYDEQQIEDAGYSEDSITPKYYDTTTGSWENYPNIIRDTENNQLIIKTDHFSTGGITGGDVPSRPTGLEAVATGSSTIVLTWTDNSSNETGFKVYREGELIDTVDENITTYTDEELDAETSYAYYVKATNEAGDSAASNTTTATTEAASGDVPDAPTDLEATNVTRSAVTLSWTDNSSDETGFKIYKNGRLIETVDANETDYTVTGLSSGTTYSFYVKATNAAGNSASSNTVSARTESGGGGGGTGGSSVPPVTVEKPASQMTEAEMLAKIAELKELIALVQQQIAQKLGTGMLVDGLPADYKFKAKLKLGAQGNDVRYLQMFLKAQGTDIYPQGLVTGYFGAMTQTAVIKFQEKYRADILDPLGLNTGTGIVGEKTLLKINGLLGR